MWYCPWIFSRGRLPRGFTLVELVIAAGLVALVAGMAASLFIFAARMTRYTSVLTLADVYGRRPVEVIKNAVRAGTTVAVVDSGNRVNITNPNGTVTAIYYQDADNNPYTLKNNQLWLLPNANAQPELVLRYVEPKAGIPLFFTKSGTDVLAIQMRIAGHSSFQLGKTFGIDIITTVGVRNQ